MGERKVSRYATICTNVEGKYPSPTGEVKTLDRAQLRMKLRPSVSPPKVWAWPTEIKNIRASSMSDKCQNYRYGTGSTNNATNKEFESSRRFKSEPNIGRLCRINSVNEMLDQGNRRRSATDLQKSIAYADSFVIPAFNRKQSLDVVNSQSKNNSESIPRKITPTKVGKRNSLDLVKEETCITDSVKDFLAKPNPQQPPDSLRVYKNTLLGDATSTNLNKYHSNGRERSRTMINPHTAPSMDMFQGKPWYYQEKASWRYLRVKDPEPLPVEKIFRD